MSHKIKSIKILNSINNKSFRIVKFKEMDCLYICIDDVEVIEAGVGCFIGICSDNKLRPINGRKMIIDGIDEV